MSFKEETGKLASRMSSTSHGVRPPSRHLTPPKAVGLELPQYPFTPPENGKLGQTWSHGLQTSLDSQQSTKPTHTQLTVNSKASRPNSVNALENPQEQAGSRVRTSSERPKSRELKQHEEAGSQATNRKRPVTCKTYQIPLIVTVDNDTRPSVEITSFGKIINRRVCSASLARDRKIPLANRGTLKSSLDPEFLKMFE